MTHKHESLCCNTLPVLPLSGLSSTLSELKASCVGTWVSGGKTVLVCVAIVRCQWQGQVS